MVFGLEEDFTSNVSLDAHIKAIPSNGIYLNSGVNPSVTVDNLLHLLPLADFSFENFDVLKEYNEFSTSSNKFDVVAYDSKVYESIQANNIGNVPSTSPLFWLETNIESLTIKNFINKVKTRGLQDLNLQKRLLENQFIYEVAEREIQLPNDYAGFEFQFRGSDYTTLKINQISIQKAGTSPINLYILNQSKLIETIQIVPSDGVVDFKDVDLVFKGKGSWRLVIDSTLVFSDSKVLNPLSYQSFTVNTITGIGNSPQTACYSKSNISNGLGVNVTASLDSDLYVKNNLSEFGSFFRSLFELMYFEVLHHNANNRLNINKKIQLDEKIVSYQLFNLTDNTISKRYDENKKLAIRQLNKTFDTNLLEVNDGLYVHYGSI